MNAPNRPPSDIESVNDGDDVLLSIIIPSYNAANLVADCLDSIYRNPPTASHEIIVVDDASNDDTSGLVKSRFPGVRLLRNERNWHYASSNNRALREARGHYICLLNNDTIVLRDAFDRLLAFLAQHPDAGAAGCRLLNADGSIQWSVKSLPNFGSAFFGARSIVTRLYPSNPLSRRHLLHLEGASQEPFVAGYVSSAAIMMPRAVVDQVGELDRRLSYHVDADYCKRIADAGYKSYYIPNATIIHLDHKGGTMGSLWRRFRSLVEFHIGSYVYYRKHLQKSRWTPLQIIVIAGLTVRFLLSAGARCLSELHNLARACGRRQTGAGVVAIEGLALSQTVDSTSRTIADAE